MIQERTYESILLERASKDDSLVIMTAENRAPIRNLPSALGPRFVDTGITEQTLIGAAAGLALRGRKPITHALATFLTLRAFEFIRTDLGISGLPVKLVGWAPGFLSDANGPTHQAIEDVSLMRGIPGFTVFCPADQEDLVLGLEAFLDAPGPGYLRYNHRKPVTSHSAFVWGEAESFGEGADVTLLVYGTLFKEAYEAKGLLESKGYSVGLLNLRTLKPFDSKAVQAALRRSSLTVTIEDHFLTGGLYSIVAEMLLRSRETANVLPLALEERWFKPALLDAVLDYEGFSAVHIAEKVEKRLKRNGEN